MGRRLYLGGLAWTGIGILLAAASQPPPSAEQSPPGGSDLGEQLLNELRCHACHDQGAPAPLSENAAPDLTEVGARVSPVYLQAFLADPHGVQPGTRMPDVLGGRSPAERQSIAEALTHYLVSLGSSPFLGVAGEEPWVESGRSLYHSVGCVACHAPRDEPRTGDDPARELTESWGGDDLHSLDHVGAKYDLESLSDFLLHPLDVRPGGRMPDMGLNARESRAIASYLIGTDARPRTAFEVRAGLVEEGARHFAAFGCGACHPLGGTEFVAEAPARSDLDPEEGCLSSVPGDTPDFHLGETERLALRTALREPQLAWTDAEVLEATFTSMRCGACHQRAGLGGIHPALDPYFTTSEPDLGDEARIPPSLDEAGTRLQRDWIGRVLFDGASVRAYMHTRMPQYGLDNLQGLPDVFERLDPPLDFEALPEGDEDRRREMRDAGRNLLGIRGGACITCHDFNGKPSPNRRGLDLVTSTERLRPGWFREFLISPQKHRPGIVMPESWPGGESALPDLGGNTEAQIQAIWNYLGLGRSARDPEGITSIRSELIVTDEVRTYRGRSRIAGFRGIAIGFPGGLSYAFDANHGSMAGIWRGNYVTTAWQGQGAGDFNPAGRAIELPRDLSFYRLPEDQAPWPRRPQMTKENPVNPDPTYPRNHGYRFRGYALDGARVPTFRYGIGNVEVEDTGVADLSGEHPRLVRTLRLSTPRAQTLWFRPLTGDIEVLEPGGFQVAGLRLEPPPGPYLLRPIGTPDASERELLLEFALPAGSTTKELIYELR